MTVIHEDLGASGSVAVQAKAQNLAHAGQMAILCARDKDEVIVVGDRGRLALSELHDCAFGLMLVEVEFGY
jgi:hypothetical protein